MADETLGGRPPANHRRRGEGQSAAARLRGSDVIVEEEVKPLRFERHGDEVEWKLTRDEAVALARYLAKEILRHEVSWFYTAQTSGRKARMSLYARARLSKITELVGEAAVEQAVAEVRDEERKGMGELLWAIFTRGTEADRDFVADATHRLIFALEGGTGSSQTGPGLEPNQDG